MTLPDRIGQCLGPYGLLWAAIHLPIIAFEEHSLTERYGAAYQEYCRRVPRFLWGWGHPLAAQIWPLRWGLAFQLEMTTIAGWLSLGLFLQSWQAVHWGAGRDLYAHAFGGGVLIWVVLSGLSRHFH